MFRREISVRDDCALILHVFEIILFGLAGSAAFAALWRDTNRRISLEMLSALDTTCWLQSLCLLERLNAQTLLCGPFV